MIEPEYSPKTQSMIGILRNLEKQLHVAIKQVSRCGAGKASFGSYKQFANKVNDANFRIGHLINEDVASHAGAKEEK